MVPLGKVALYADIVGRLAMQKICERGTYADMGGHLAMQKICERGTYANSVFSHLAKWIPDVDFPEIRILRSVETLHISARRFDLRRRNCNIAGRVCGTL